jgi:O-antigen biosynthesis protein
LVNGESIIQEDVVDELTYIHLEFDGHTVIFAEGAPSESFVDDDSRQMFDNAAEYARLYPDAISEPVQFCAQRVEEGWELQAVRERLARRAETMRVPADGAGMRDFRPILASATRRVGAAMSL